jgi:hypothetical protein
MIERRRCEHVDDAAGGAAFWIRATKNEPFDSGRGDRSGAHRARLFGYVERAANSPYAQRFRRLANRKDLSVRRGIRAPLFLVARLESAPTGDEDGTDGYFPGGSGFAR